MQLLLGEILIQNGFITNMQLKIALEHQKKRNDLIGIILLELNYITEDQLETALLIQSQSGIKIKKNFNETNFNEL